MDNDILTAFLGQNSNQFEMSDAELLDKKIFIQSYIKKIPCKEYPKMLSALYYNPETADKLKFVEDFCIVDLDKLSNFALVHLEKKIKDYLESNKF